MAQRTEPSLPRLEAFLNAITKIDTFRGESAFGSWLYGRHAAPVVDWSAVVDDPSRRIEVRLAVRDAIEELPAYYRATVVLQDVVGWTSAEVAEALGISLGTVKTRVHRAVPAHRVTPRL